MIEWVGEAALRSLAVAAIVRLGMGLLRITHAHQEKLIWTTVLAGALAMPLLARWEFLPTSGMLSFSLPTVALHGTDPVERYHLGTAVAMSYWGVSLLLLLRVASGAGRMWRIKSRAVPLRESWTLGMDVRIARELSGPVTFGATILLPRSHTSWTEAKRTTILQHEQAHVRHHDSPVQWLAALHASLFWFSPLAWWLRRRLAQLAEYTSDDEVLRRDIQKADYATILLEEARTRCAQSLLVGIASCSVERRVERILAGALPARPLSRLRRALAVVSVCPIIALAADAAAVKVPPPSRSAQERNLFGMDRSHPYIIASPSQADLRRYYPQEAARKGINGLVQITVTLDRAGHATDTHILSEAPVGVGFGAAASELAHQFKYSNATGHSASVTYKVKFELDRSREQAAGHD